MWMSSEQDPLCTSPGEETGPLANNALLTQTAPHRTAPHRTAPHHTTPHHTTPHHTTPHRSGAEQSRAEQSRAHQTKQDQTKTDQTKTKRTEPNRTEQADRQTDKHAGQPTRRIRHHFRFFSGGICSAMCLRRLLTTTPPWPTLGCSVWRRRTRRLHLAHAGANSDGISGSQPGGMGGRVEGQCCSCCPMFLGVGSCCSPRWVRRSPCCMRCFVRQISLHAVLENAASPCLVRRCVCGSQ